MIQELFGLAGKTALITGASRGIGFALARGLGQAGAAIVLNGHDEGRLEKAVRLLKQEGFKVSGSLFDVRDEKAVQRQVEKIENETGKMDILINNAGVQYRGPLEYVEEKNWREILDIHLTGAFLVSKAVVQGMIQRKSGKIINICSIQSELARATIVPYAAAKGGLKMLTQGMAAEWGKHNIQVNGIAPGYFKTDMTRPLYEDKTFNAWLCARTPANRWGELSELVGAVLFLASKASDYVNGHLLFVDGGLRACV